MTERMLKYLFMILYGIQFFGWELLDGVDCIKEAFGL